MKAKKSMTRWLTALALLFASAAVSRASTFVQVSDEDLARQATVIVEGTVAGIESVAPPGEAIYTYVTIDPQVILKGDIPNAPFVIRERGGTVAGRTEWTWGSPSYAIGERVFLFLKSGDDGVLHTLDLTLGKFAISASPSGESVQQDLSYGSIVYTPFGGSLRRSPNPQAQGLSSFAAKVRSAIEGQAEESADAVDLIPA